MVRATLLSLGFKNGRGDFNILHVELISYLILHVSFYTSHISDYHISYSIIVVEVDSPGFYYEMTEVAKIKFNVFGSSSLLKISTVIRSESGVFFTRSRICVASRELWRGLGKPNKTLRACPEISVALGVLAALED